MWEVIVLHFSLKWIIDCKKYDAYYKNDCTDIKRDFPTYMFLKSEFVYLDYISIMVMCVFKIHYFSNLLDKSKRI